MRTRRHLYPLTSTALEVETLVPQGFEARVLSNGLRSGGIRSMNPVQWTEERRKAEVG